MIEAFARIRQRIGYAASWFGMLGVPLLVVDLIQKKLELINVHIPFLVLTGSTMLGMALGGYLLERIGFIDAEYKWNWDRSRAMQQALIAEKKKMRKKK